MAFPTKIDIKYTEKASRLELLIRLVLMFVYGIIAEIWGIFVLVAWILQWFHILFMGRRHKSLENFMKGFWRYWTRVVAYALRLTDERPPISGQA